MAAPGNAGGPSPRFADGLWAAFLRTGAIRMNFPDRTVQIHRFNLDADQLFALQFGKQPIQYTGFRPAIHARVDGVPVTEALRQGPLLAAVLSDEENRVNHVEVPVRDVATLSRQVHLDARVLYGSDFHARSTSCNVNVPRLTIQTTCPPIVAAHAHPCRSHCGIRRSGSDSSCSSPDGTPRPDKRLWRR